MKTKPKSHPGLEGLDPLVEPGEVCRMFSVTYEALDRWHKEGKFMHVLLPGGSKRYRLGDVRKVIKGEWVQDPTSSESTNTPRCGERAS